ncbi:hypothetical protein OG883_42250 [Streptomyces sp. NBC_01142]|nr:hypothetical protein [Streptomyces sp. NBC_01142]
MTETLRTPPPSAPPQHLHPFTLEPGRGEAERSRALIARERLMVQLADQVAQILKRTHTEGRYRAPGQVLAAINEWP